MNTSRPLITRCDVLPLVDPSMTSIATPLGVHRPRRSTRPPTRVTTPAATRRRRRSPVLGLLALVGLVACAGDDAGDRVDLFDAADQRTVVVDSVDFAFVGLPEEIEAGTRLELTNSANTELHELVAFRLADSETRPVAEIVRDDPDALFSDGPPKLVVLTAPGGEQIVAVGDGTLGEPGRYAIVCMIPTGVDAATYLEAAASSDGPPQIPGGGVPHLAHGMFAEVTVTG